MSEEREIVKRMDHRYVTTDDDIRLISVVNEIKKLKQKISDAEWDEKPTKVLEEKLRYFEELHRNGIDVEPEF